MPANAHHHSRALGVHDRIGEALAGSVMRCRVCGGETRLTAEDVARNVAEGWPSCCGEIMGLARQEADT